MTETPQTTTESPNDAIAATPATSAPEHAEPRSWHGAFWLAQILVLLPIWVAAYRDGHGGWYPTMDAATTVLRARDTFSGDFPLIGMWSSVSDKLGTATYFPGATELYLLSIPNELFGYSWGTLIGIATINSVWLLAAGWLLRRRLGTIGAIWGLGAVALLVWTMGSEALMDVAPMQMITIPFAVFLIAVWSVADGDLGALPVFAVLANFLVLDHLVLTLLVPVIGLCTLIGLVVSLRARRREHPDRWLHERRHLKRQSIIALAITVVLWLPSLIEQFTNSPGNLTNLYDASQIDLPRTVSTGEAFDVVIRILAVPPFWLRDSFNTHGGASSPGWGIITIGLAVIVLTALLFRSAYRRGDRTTLSALGVGTIAVVVSILNILNAPTDYGFRQNYFRSLWGMAMFFWLAVGLAAARSFRDRSCRTVDANKVGIAGIVFVLVVTMAAVPHHAPAADTNGTSTASVDLANKLMNQAIVRIRDHGQVEVSSAGDFMSFGLSSTLILLLEDAGVDVCVPREMVAQYGKKRKCQKDGADLRVRVSSMAFPPYAGETLIIDTSLLSRAEQREKKQLGKQIFDWLATQDGVHASPMVRRILVDAYGPAAADRVEAEAFATRGYPLATLAFSPEFVEFVTKRSVRHADGTVDAAIDTPGLDPDDLVRWADLTWREYTGESVRITRVEEPAPSDDK